MRKADYQTLARIISKKRQYAKSIMENALTDSRRQYGEGLLEATLAIADEFSSFASVDKFAFLKACGIE